MVVFFSNKKNRNLEKNEVETFFRMNENEEEILTMQMHFQQMQSKEMQ